MVKSETMGIVNSITYYKHKNKDANIVLVVASILFLASLVFLYIVWQRPGETLVLPEFEQGVSNIAEMGEIEGYSLFDDPNIPFKCGLVAKPEATDSGINLYFANPDGNDVWLLVKVFNSKGWLTGETGLIKPGEYIKEVKGDFERGDSIKIQVFSYKPEFYYSSGTFVLNTVIAGEPDNTVESEVADESSSVDLTGTIGASTFN